MTTTIVVLRSMTDFIYLIHILLQFRLAYVAPESRVMGAGDLVDDPKKIARNYFFGYFLIDLFVVLPLPQKLSVYYSNTILNNKTDLLNHDAKAYTEPILPRVGVSIDYGIHLPIYRYESILLLGFYSMGATGANYAKNLLRAAILIQYIPRLYRFLPLLAGQSPTGFIFESAWANFVMNLLTFVLASHVVGSCWYLFGLQVGLLSLEPFFI
ncbi:UNVERIFIED_CONTAM: putative cyclic nucleotide-gated ion channel 20, chloroplastic [Sesamum latifolium]|uniref:Cyclic nucleotide-gated ion channel 20, chloroplastic n=1 Tax=Sesamum latifolium TaxID=2727402 RepID=A0AAW2UJH4_9LAMI